MQLNFPGGSAFAAAGWPRFGVSDFALDVYVESLPWGISKPRAWQISTDYHVYIQNLPALFDEESVENSIGIMARQELRNILEIFFGERFEWRFQRLLRGEGYADSEWAGMAEGDEAVVEVVGDGVDAHGKDGDDAVAREGEGGAGPGEPDVPEDVAHGRP